MTASNCLYIIAIALVVIGWGTLVHAEGNGAGGGSSTTTGDGSTPAVAPDGTPVVHKSLHKKKKSTASSSTTDKTTSTASSTAPVITVPKAPDTVLTVTAKTGLPGAISSLSPTVETGLPVARHSDIASLTSPPISDSIPSPTTYRSTLNGGLANPGVSSSTINSYTSTTHTTTSNYTFIDFPKKNKNTYPWKTGIYTTMFFIGEGGSSISNTDNKASSFDANWVESNRGTDNPNDRNGYASGSHASTVNPFYIALPFNDLVYPDKARRWLPAGWHRPNKDGKPVSACKDRWVEIKAEDGSGHVCYAQWEDVGPLRYDHAEYVFGDERPDTFTRAGLDVSPAVFEYLGMKEMKHPVARWRFVDDDDVPPGQWLKLDEQAVIYQAMHHPGSNPTSNLPIQRASQPIDDDNTQSNKKKVGAAKG